MAKRRKTIYSGDATVVEQVTNTNETVGMSDDVSVFKMDTEQTLIGKTFYVDEVFDTFVSYIIPRLEVSELSKRDTETSEDSSVVCMICGGHTSKPSRKICFPCMTKHRDALYKKLKTAILNGDKTLSF